MKTKMIMPAIAIGIIAISGFFVYGNFVTNTNLAHHEEIVPTIPDDHFAIHGIKWEWNDYVYDVNEEINFTVSRYAKICGDLFDAKIMNTDWSETFWQESIPSNCIADHEELIDNDYYSVFVTAEFPSQNSITLEEGLYVLRIKSKDSHVDGLEGQFIVKDSTKQPSQWDFRTLPSYVIIPKGSAMPDNEFHLVPSEITVFLGKNNTVIWINEDDTPSTLVSNSFEWSTGLILPGDTASVTFNETGVYKYYGMPHPWKVGTITVLKD